MLHGKQEGSHLYFPITDGLNTLDEPVFCCYASLKKRLAWCRYVWLWCTLVLIWTWGHTTNHLKTRLDLSLSKGWSPKLH